MFTWSLFSINSGFLINKKFLINGFPFENKISIEEAIKKKVKIIIIVRNPYNRLFSGICDKHIRILNRIDELGKFII